MQKYVPLFGWIGIVFGLICITGFFLPDAAGLAVSMIAMLLGFLFSSLYIMLTTRYELETPKINPGYVGLLLSSTPVILFIVFILISE